MKFMQTLNYDTTAQYDDYCRTNEAKEALWEEFWESWLEPRVGEERYEELSDDHLTREQQKELDELYDEFLEEKNLWRD